MCQLFGFCKSLQQTYWGGCDQRRFTYYLDENKSALLYPFKTSNITILFHNVADSFCTILYMCKNNPKRIFLNTAVYRPYAEKAIYNVTTRCVNFIGQFTINIIFTTHLQQSRIPIITFIIVNTGRCLILLPITTR